MAWFKRYFNFGKFWLHKFFWILEVSRSQRFPYEKSFVNFPNSPTSNERKTGFCSYSASYVFTIHVGIKEYQTNGGNQDKKCDGNDEFASHLGKKLFRFMR